MKNKCAHDYDASVHYIIVCKGGRPLIKEIDDNVVIQCQGCGRSTITTVDELPDDKTDCVFCGSQRLMIGFLLRKRSTRPNQP